MEPKSRPAIFLNKADSTEENFQNATIRPILKLQHNLIMTLSRQIFDKKKMKWEKLREQDAFEWLPIHIQKDIPFKNQLIGMVIGQFNLEELSQYLLFPKEMNKRIIHMVIERIMNHYVNH